MDNSKNSTVKNMECTHRTNDEKKALITRLNVIAGQTKGITKMIDGERSCEEILGQLASVENSLKSVGVELLKTHLSATVSKKSKIDADVIDEVINLIKKTNI